MSRSPISPPTRRAVMDRLDPARLETGRIRPEGMDRLQIDLALGMPRATDRLRWIPAFEAWRTRWGV